MPHDPIRRLRFRLPWRSRRALGADVDAELEFHLDMRTEELIARHGLAPAEARAEAIRQFGDLEDARRSLRDIDRRQQTRVGRRERLRGLWQDLGLAARALCRAPLFAGVVVLALALGIGSVTAIFTLLNDARMRDLPVPHPEELVGFGDDAFVGSTETGPPRTDVFSYPLYLSLRDGARSVASLAATGYSSRLEIVPASPASSPAVPPPVDAQPDQARGRLVSGNYFRVLEVPALIGRTLRPEDDAAPGAGPVAVISHAYWQRRFAGDPSIVGRVLIVNRTPVTVVGVTPEGFAGEITGRRTDIWLPLTMQPLLLPNQNWLADLDTSWLLLLGRLSPGATVVAAGEELTALARRTLTEETGTFSAQEAAERTVPAFSAPRGFSGMPREADFVFVILLALSGLILVVVTANVANLLLARAAARRREIGIRMALGAGRARAVRHLLAEILLLGIAAGTAALAVLAVTRTLLLRRLEASGTSFPLGLALDTHVVAFTAGISLLAALVLGLIPALHVTGGRARGALHVRGETGDSGNGAHRGMPFGRMLVVAQMALSLVLLAGAGLLVRSLQNLHARELGLAEEEILIVALDAHAADDEGAPGGILREELATRLGSIAGVESVSYSQNGLFSGIEAQTEITVPGIDGNSPVRGGSAFDRIGPRYFQTLGARLLLGREIEADDGAGPGAAVVNESFAHRYLPAGDPIGRTFQAGDESYTVVGMVADVQGQSLRARDEPRFYLPFDPGSASGLLVYEVRTRRPAAIRAAARRELLGASPQLRVRRIDPLAALVDESLGADRVVATLSGAAGLVALMLSALGLYGIVSYGISRRTREFGVRLAVGARPEQVTGMVMRESLRVMWLGSVLGIPLAIAVGRLLRTQLADVGAVDLPSLLIALAVLSATAVLAGYLPARRAARIEPRAALASD